MSSAAPTSPIPQPPAAHRRGTPPSTGLPHLGSHSRYSAGCRCPACTAAHADYLAQWRAGRIHHAADTTPVRAHLHRLVASGLVLGHLADEARVPRRTVYAIWHGTRRTSPHTAAALLALRPLRIADALPPHVQAKDALAGANTRQRRTIAIHDLDLDADDDLAAHLGISRRTVQRWRAAQHTSARAHQPRTA